MTSRRASIAAMLLTAGVAIGASAIGASPARAQDTASGTGPVPDNVGPNPTPICTDRPTKASVACSVPAGDFQLESGVVNWTRSDVAGTRTDTTLFGNPTLKYGVGTHTDLEVNLVPYETVATTRGGTTTTAGSAGDLYLRVKQRLTADGSKTQVALIPFVKAPTAKVGVGNGAWEGGVAAPANIPLPAAFTLTVVPEIDVLADDRGSGHHASLISLVNVSHGIGPKITVFAELWNSQNLDPAGTVHQYSADVAATYSLSPTLQLDLGGNFGLNRATPASQVYFGVSTRF